jgi:hypothetical protein
LDICRDTLAQYYEHELGVGAAQVRMEIAEAMLRVAKRGNVAAAKWCSQGAQPMPDSLEIPPATGVKAARNEAAKTAGQGTAWEKLGLQ